MSAFGRSAKLTVMQNITPQTKEQELTSAVRELKDVRAALDAHSIVAITDGLGKITHVNDEFCSISKYPREELLGQDHRIINSGHHPRGFFRDLWATILRGGVWRGEIKNRAKDGSHYWVDTTLFPFFDKAGVPVQFIAIRTDITRRKADEEALKGLTRDLADKNRELEAILYAASHDLRTPLVNIQGFSWRIESICEELQGALLSGDERMSADLLGDAIGVAIPQALGFIQAGVVKMDSLLSGLLRYSRLGRVMLNLEPLDMGRLVGEVVQALRFQTEQAGASLRLESLPACVGDASQMGQVFSNLIDNALKYRDPKRPLRIDITGWVEKGRTLYAVADNGIGIEPENQVAILEIFLRLDLDSTVGEGLGLAIAQRSLERQHGEIRVESQMGIGSTFLISLPRIPERP